MKSRLMAVLLALVTAGAADGAQVAAGRSFAWGRIDDCERFAGLHPRFAEAFEFMRRADLAALPVGRYEIVTNDVWALVTESELTPFGETQRPEVHRAFIDIQSPIDGPETYGLYDSTGERFEPFDAAKDVGFADRRTKPLALCPGEFVIFFPESGAHAPCKSPSGRARRKKLIIKVRK